MVELVAVLQETVGDAAMQEKAHIRKTRESLEAAVNEGILFMSQDFAEENSTDLNNASIRRMPSRSSLISYSAHSNSVAGTSVGTNNTYRFTFCHDVWRTTVLTLMLDSRKRDIHRIIAKTLEARLSDRTDDYLSKMKLFSHWKASGESSKAVALAFSIGKSYEEMGMINQSILLYQEALRIWTSDDDNWEYISEASHEALDSLSVDDLENIIKIYVALGRSYATGRSGQESVEAYQSALKVLSLASSSDELKDRSIVFPIFNGLFVAIRFGQIEQDDDCTYEQTLVAQFVKETRLHGDPIHFAGALAMQTEMFGRLRKFKKAVQSFERLDSFYIAEDHSEDICKAYGSDRAAQCFSLTASWQKHLGNTTEAMALCDRVTKQLLPKMDGRNVHNSFLILYPTIWLLKDDGRALEAKTLFERYIVQPFERYFGPGGTTSYLPLYEPILMLLELAGGAPEDVRTDCLDWALVEDNLQFGAVLNNDMGTHGRCGDTISAEICLILAKDHYGNPDEAVQLIQSGLNVAMKNLSFTQKRSMYLARDQSLLVYKQLMGLAQIVLGENKNGEISTASYGKNAL